MLEQFLWVEKYRPTKVADAILPEELKKTFQSFVDQKNIPNLLLAGTPGTGKTTVARAMLEELECDYILINASMNRGIDVVRNQILQFASSISMVGGRKYVILDEADNLTGDAQNSLKSFMEEFSSNCGFILTCNTKGRIIEPIQSRCSVIDFKIPKTELPSIAAGLMKRVCFILDTENISYDKKVIIEVIKKHLPDWRRVLNELQRYAPSGTIDSGILVNMSDESIRALIGLLKEKDFTNMRKWVAENSDLDVNTVFRKLYDQASTHMKKDSIPEAVLIIGRYQYQHSFCADFEINLACCLTELMVNVEFN